jgi:hypothetical protein
MTIRNQRYPNLRDNTQGRCFTCGSDCPDGQCPRDCDQNGPRLTVDGKPMLDTWRLMSQELGATRWFSNDEGMRSEIEFWTAYLQKQPERQPALKHLQDKLKELGLA